ncbi:hypothetical protein PM082_006004 [Marasmius tenuissimus]|nr:hypothetical protein PM082_006004 [Marasmius tenuissimus]
MPPTRTKSTRPASGIRAKRSQWKASLKTWTVDPDYRVPGGSDNPDVICTKTQAKTVYGLDEHDLATIPHQTQENSSRKIYPLKEVEYLSTLKKQALNCEGDSDGESDDEKVKATQSSQSPKKRKKAPEFVPSWRDHAFFPQPPPMILKGPYKVICRPEMPDPKEIEWRLGKIIGPISVSDACRLYVLRPEDIQDLVQNSMWIDSASAAKRALSLHGGYSAHRNLVKRTRRKEEARLEREGKDRSDFEWSPIVQEQLDWKNRDNTSEIPRWRMPEESDGPRKINRVAVLYPIQKYQVGTTLKWYPPRNDF